MRLSSLSSLLLLLLTLTPAAGFSPLHPSRPTPRSALRGLKLQSSPPPSGGGAPLLRSTLGRREALLLGAGVLGAPGGAGAEEERKGSLRKGRPPLTQQDFAFVTGKYPPRVLVFESLPRQEKGKPVYNAWGLCVEDSCGYVGLKQRYEGYKKYKAAITEVSTAVAAISGGASNAEVGSEEALGKNLRRAILFANTQLISENYGTGNEALVSRFYVNEAYYALGECFSAKDEAKRQAAADLLRDSWNSYLTVVNRAIVPKVGDKFALIPA
eukprot:CAMPEP_0173457010 /NCGR_PEP_ID=MMETSP1357-20121228/57000_1 /TAXON_ID=77926 /ORGANISM="Hemiselmis rufescens, Strain PCC563" /LENGTH=269 /DNA_ID=CAMNT_0014424277 /DNA_START=102 /DNA_END=911 /DNA_ORIENTATION=+